MGNFGKLLNALWLLSAAAARAAATADFNQSIAPRLALPRLVVASRRILSPPLNSPTQHSDDATLRVEASIRVVGASRQRLQQSAALELHSNQHVEHTDRRHGAAEEDETRHGEYMSIKVVLHLQRRVERPRT